MIGGGSGWVTGQGSNNLEDGGVPEFTLDGVEGFVEFFGDHIFDGSGFLYCR